LPSRGSNADGIRGWKQRQILWIESEICAQRLDGIRGLETILPTLDLPFHDFEVLNADGIRG
jgi:hypothetical protein